MLAMHELTDPLFQKNFVGALSFLPSGSDSSAVCELEFSLPGADLLARISLRDKAWEISSELLLCMDGEQRFRSRREISPYGTDTNVQLVLYRDRLTCVMVDGEPHLRVVGEWIERTPTKSGERRAVWVMEGLLKQSSLSPAKLDDRDKFALRALYRSWPNLR